jgi:opacity protein-like surface antigen
MLIGSLLRSTPSQGVIVMFKRTVVLGLLLGVGTSATAMAQAAQAAPKTGWEFMIAPYLLFPYMNGDVTVGPVKTDINADASDIFSNLQFGAMLYMEARNPQWAIGFDGLYMDLSKDGEKLPTKYDGYEASLELTGFRRATPWLEILAGGRLNLLGTSATLEPIGTILNKDVAFFDPFVGARVTVPNTGRWDYSIRGDVGGFGVGSQFTWQMRFNVGYRVSKVVTIGASYWLFDIDYEQGSGINYFKYDVLTSGPEVGVAFTF